MAAGARDASAVIMVNNGDGLPPFEGPIAGVTIPFIGVSESDDDDSAAHVVGVGVVFLELRTAGTVGGFTR